MAAGNAVGGHRTFLNRQSFYAGLFVGIRDARARDSARSCTERFDSLHFMTLASKIGLGIAALATAGILDAVETAKADDVPDALSVEWQGKKPCEKLFDDAQVRVVRCTFPPGAVHVCHSHPGYLSYVVNGGQGQVQDEKGIRKIDVVSGALLDVPPTPWHEFANVGDTTIQFVVVEKKYQVVAPVSQAACPKTIGRAQ